jgi:hypothetical protein
MSALARDVKYCSASYLKRFSENKQILGNENSIANVVLAKIITLNFRQCLVAAEDCKLAMLVRNLAGAFQN